MALDIKGFIGGMDKDISPYKTRNDTLYDANNLRILTDDGESSFSIVNTRGNEELTIVNATDASNSYNRDEYTIVAAQGIRDDFVVFWAKNDNSGWGIIDLLVWNEDETFTRVELYKSSSEDTNLDFFPNQPMEIEFAYEGSDLIRIYFTNEFYPMRILNVGVEQGEDKRLEASYDDLRTSLVDKFDRIPFVNHVTPQFSAYGGGSLLTGVYQYAYRFLTNSGVYSSISPASETIPVSPNITRANSSTLYGGDTAEEQNSGVSIVMTIDLTNTDLTNFDKIEVLSLYYSAAADTPTINIIESQGVVQGVYSFTDDSAEAKFGTLTYPEFQAGTFDFSAATLATKDNRLFAANLKENAFDIDFDARAYRFDDTGVCHIWNSGVQKEVIRTGTSAPYQYLVDGQPIPEDADAVNRRNIDPSLSYQYNTLQTGPSASGYAYGGEGPNVSYTFSYQEYEVVGYANGRVENSGSINSENEAYLLGRKKGFKRGECYRFGIVFFSKKGIASPVKWIGDIEIPYGENPENLHIVHEGKAYIVYPDFVVNTAGTQAFGLDYQIVYVEKDSLTRKIVAEGYLNQVVRERSGGYEAPYRNASPWRWTAKEMLQAGSNQYVSDIARELNTSDSENNDYLYTLGSDATPGFEISTWLVSLHTPEQVLLPFDYKSGLRLRVDGVMGLQMDSTTGARKEREFESGVNLTPLDRIWVSEVEAVLPTTQDTTFSTISRPNLAPTELLYSSRNEKTDQEDNPHERNWYNAKSLILSLDSWMPESWLDSSSVDIDKTLFRATLYRSIVPYNGDSYSDRLNNEYIPASDVVKGAALPVADRGDTLITYFDYTRIYYPIDIQGSKDISNPIDDLSRGWQTSMWFPVESRVNCYLRHDNSYLKGGGQLASDSDPNIYKWLIQEKGNPTGDLYLYDDVFSKPDNSKRYISLSPEDVIATTVDTRIRYSEVKQQGEEIDNWAIFKANNYKDAQTEFGPVNRLVEFNNEIYFFQDSGFGLMSINPRATYSGGDGIATVLGTGQTLDRFAYISTEIGSQKNSDIVKSMQSIYWLDALKKKLYRFSGNIESLSDLKGLSGYLRNTISTDSKLRGVYDNEYSEVYFTIGNRKYDTVTADLSYTITEEQEYYEIQTVPETTYTNAKVEITATTAVSSTSYIELTFVNGIGATIVKRFTAVDSNPVLGDEFLAAGDALTSITSLSESINTYIADNNLYYTAIRNGTQVDVTANEPGPAYNFNPSVYNKTEESTAPSARITANAIKEDSWIELTFEGTTMRFTAKNSPVVADKEFPASQITSETLSGLETVINFHLGLAGITTYTVTRTIGSPGILDVQSTEKGDFYNLNATFFNNAVSDTVTADAGGTDGFKDITGGPQPIPEDNSWVVVDFTTAGGVDRLDLYKNGVVVAQSGMLQGSNYGFPDLDNPTTPVDVYVVDRSDPYGKDFKPLSARQLYKGEYNAGTTYEWGDVIKDSGGNYFVSMNNNFSGIPPSGSPGLDSYWVPQVAEGGFDTKVFPDGSAYNKFTSNQSFIGTNTMISQDPPTEGVLASTTGMVPTRYQDFLDDGGQPSEEWLGADGTLYEDNADPNFKQYIRGGTLSHYNFYSNNYVRGQRVWAKYNSTDTFEIKCMGGWQQTAYKLTYWVLTSGISDLNVLDEPAITVDIPSDLEFYDYPSTGTTVNVTKPVLVTKTTTTNIKKAGQVTTVVVTDNRYGTLSTATGTDITHKITGLVDNYRFNKYVDYEIGGAIFEVTQLDFDNNTIYLNLVEGTPTLGTIDLSEYLEFRSPFTVNYNEILGKFISFHSFIPTLYVKGNRYFFSTINSRDLYEHNHGNFGEFYGTKYDTSFDISMPTQLVNEFTNVSWFSKTNKDSEPIPERTIYALKAYTDVQESDDVKLYPRSDLRYIKDTEGTRLPNNGISPDPEHPYSTLFNVSKNANAIWRAPIPRIKEEPADKYDENFNIITDGREFRERVIGGFCKLRFKVKNDIDEYRYVIDDIRIKNDVTWQ